MKPDKAIQEYQCVGCVNGPYPDCYKTNGSLACDKHCAGTTVGGIGRVFLGLPTGFNRLGISDETKVHIFLTLKDGWGYDKFNVPVWKHLDQYGNTLVRGMCPRLNAPWIHIFLNDFIKEIDCLEISHADINEMDQQFQYRPGDKGRRMKVTCARLNMTSY